MEPVIKVVRDVDHASGEHSRLAKQFLEHAPKLNKPHICVCEDCELFRLMVSEGQAIVAAMKVVQEDAVMQGLLGGMN